jgi:hypothetical protein
MEMSKSVQARLTIPLTDDHDRSKGDPLVFRRWLPLQDKDTLRVAEDGLQLRFWIDKDCLGHVTDLDLSQIGSYENIFISRLKVDVMGISVRDDLADAMIKLSSETNWVPEHINAAYDPGLVDQHHGLGKRIYSAVIKRFNRLIAYVRAAKGQYRLREYKPDYVNLHSEFIKLRARVRVGDSDWRRLTSTGAYRIEIPPPVDEPLISEEDWAGFAATWRGIEKPHWLVNCSPRPMTFASQSTAGLP